MKKSKTLFTNIRGNFIELWLGLLLFLGLPTAVALYTDWRGFVATTIVMQAVILTLYVYKENS